MKSELKEKRIVLISNGEPYQHIYEDSKVKMKKSAGGLTTGLDPMMQENDGLWIAWGRGEADFEKLAANHKLRVPDQNGYTLKRIKLNEKEKQGFYYGFSNEVMWPISHNFISKANYKEEYWFKYQRVNKKYAENVLEELEPDDLVWIHDYHLVLLPEMIKEKAPQAKTSLFWHIPWASWESFRTIPWRREILEGILAADFLAFHTELFVDNFLDCAEKMGAEINYAAGEVYYKDSKTKVKSIPLGIDYQKFNKLAQDKDYLAKARQLKESYNTDKLIFAVDRLDYTKGIEKRLTGIDKFLEKYPSYQGEVTFVQRVAPSRTGIDEYQKMKTRIEKKVAEINGKYQKDQWQPVKYFYGSVPQKELLPYYKAADLALITALIDGMNLVAKEYLAVQDQGVLVLSEFAGAADYLESSVKVNPYNIKEVSEKIYQALEMSDLEKEKRIKEAQLNLKKYDINWWRDCFLKEWLQSYE